MSYYRTVPDSCQIPRISEKYTDIFGEKNNGFFVEVGAFDGETYSNTCFLADMGWKGFYIEPVPVSLEKCKKRHKNNSVGVQQFLVGSEEGEKEIHVAGEISTMNEKQLQIFQKMDWSKGKHSGQKVKCKQVTLDSFFEVNQIPVGIDLLVIDVEGQELHVLKGFSIEKWKPYCVIVEIHDLCPSYTSSTINMIEEYKETRQYMIKNGYKLYYSDEINSIYILESKYE